MNIKKYAVPFFVLFLFFFGGCTSNKNIDDGTTTVRVAFWGGPNEIGIVTDCIKDWESEHPDIKVKFEHTPYSGYAQKVMTCIAGNVPLDVICMEVNSFVSFSSNGVLADLTPFIKEDGNFNIEDFFPEVVDRFTVDGHIYALPRDTAPFACVYYNKDIFDAEGVPYPTDDWTWDDMLDIAQKLTKRDERGRIVRYGFYGWAWQNFIYGNGGKLVDNVKFPKKCLINEKEAVEGMQFYVDLINKYRVMPTPVALSNSGMGVDYMFASGRLAMFLSGIWETPTFRKYDFDWDVVMFPKNSKGIRHFGTGGSGYGVLHTSKHKREAWEVVKALTSVSAQVKLAEMGLAQPARIAVAESEHFAGNDKKPKNKKMLNEAVKYAVYDPFSPAWREIEAKYIMPELDLVKSGKKGVREAFDKIAEEVDKKLNEQE